MELRFWKEEMENEQEMKSTRTVPRRTVDAEVLGQDWAGELVEQRGPSVTGEERTRGQIELKIGPQPHKLHSKCSAAYVAGGCPVVYLEHSNCSRKVPLACALRALAGLVKVVMGTAASALRGVGTVGRFDGSD